MNCYVDQYDLGLREVRFLAKSDFGAMTPSQISRRLTLTSDWNRSQAKELDSLCARDTDFDDPSIQVGHTADWAVMADEVERGLCNDC